jgi:hypothetical protein
MSNQDGIKPSRKFAKGVIHETASGKFMVLERFLKDTVLMIKIQWLDTGVIEENKEVNLSASIYKFQKSRGLIDATDSQKSSDVVTLQDIKECIDKLFETLALRTDLLQDALEKIKENRYTLKIQHEMIEEQNRRINKIMDKLIEKM